MALDDPGAPCVTGAPAPTVASREKKMPRLMTLSSHSCGESSGSCPAQLWMWEERKKRHVLSSLLPPISFTSPHSSLDATKFLVLPLSLVSAISCAVCAWTSAGLRLCERMIPHVVSPLTSVFYFLPLFSHPFLISIFFSFFFFRPCILDNSHIFPHQSTSTVRHHHVSYFLHNPTASSSFTGNKY